MSSLDLTGMNIWEASRFGALSRIDQLHQKDGNSVSARHPTPGFLIDKAKSEAEWISSSGRATHLSIKGGQWTPLHVASAYGQTAVVHALLDYQVNADQKDFYPRSPTSTDHSPHKKNKKKEAEPGWNALHWAAHTGNLRMLQILLSVTTLSLRTKKTLCSVLQYTTIKKHDSTLKETQTAARTAAKQLHTWGSGIHFALGNGTPNTRSIPYPVNIGDNLSIELCETSKYYTLCACSDEHDDYSLWSWGVDKEGCLGLSDPGSTVPLPSRIEFECKKVISIAVGTSHSCIVTDEGFLFTFGCGDYGKLGHGNTRSVEKPKCVRELFHIPIAQVKAGDDHTVALSYKGEVFSWGCGSSGQTGTGLFEDTCIPSRVPGAAEHTVVEIQARANISLLLLEDRKKLLYFGNGHSSCIPTHNPSPGKAGSITSMACGAKFVSFCTSFGKSFVAHWRDEKIKLIEGEEVLVSNLSPFQKIELQGSQAAKVFSSKEILFVYDQEQQVWEFRKLPSLQNPHTYVLDNVLAMSCSNYHSSAIIARSLENTSVLIDDSLHGQHIVALLGSDQFADIAVRSSDDSQFTAHRCILSTCPFFEQLLSQNKNSNVIAVELDAQQVRILLEIIYSGTLRAHANVDTQHFLTLLERYDLGKYLPKELLYARYRFSIPISQFALPPIRFAPLLSASSTLCDMATHDIVIQSKSQEQIPCHRAILAARCPFFDALLSSSFRETNLGVIQIPNSSTECIKKIVEFIYTDDISRKTPVKTSIEVLILANEFLIPRLKQICEEILASSIHIDSLDIFIEIGEIHEATQLREACYEYMVDHLYEIIECGMFATLDISTLQALQQIIDNRIQLQDNKLTSSVLPPNIFLAAMEEEFQFGELMETETLLVSPRVETQAENVPSRIRNLRKKIHQVYRIEDKKNLGEKLNNAQLSKMYQRASLLRQMSELTGESIDAVIRDTKNSYAMQNTKPVTPHSPDIVPQDSATETPTEHPTKDPVCEELIAPISEPKEDNTSDGSDEPSAETKIQGDEIGEQKQELSESVQIPTEDITVELPKPAQELPTQSPLPTSTPGNQGKKRRRRRNNSNKKNSTTFSLTSPQRQTENKPKEPKPSTLSRNMKAEVPVNTNRKPWGGVSPQKQTTPLSAILQEQKNTPPRSSKPMQIPSKSPTRTGWCSPPKATSVPIHDIQSQQRRPKKQNQKQRQARNRQNTDLASSVSPPHHAPRAKHKPRSFSELMAEQQEQKKTSQKAPSLREIMGQELTAKIQSNPHDEALEQKLLELAIQASLEDM